jgi:type IV secretion system protein VirB10
MPQDSSILTTSDDVHESKIDPTDPRLKIKKAASRTLKKGPIIGVGFALLGIVFLAFGLLFTQSPNSATTKKEEPIPVATQVPDVIKTGPGNDTPVFKSENSPKLGEKLPGDLGNTMVKSGRVPYASSSASRQLSPAEQEAAAARAASPFFGGNSPGQGAQNVNGILGATTPSAIQQPEQSDPNMQSQKLAFSKTAGSDAKELNANVLKPALSKYAVSAGSVIPVLLVTGINSDLPGNVVGMVNENVYDSRTGRFLLIPQGTRVLGTYSSNVSYGQKRVQVVWHRIIRPDGASMILDTMPGVDLSGSSGYADKVDSHLDQISGGVALSSLITGAAGYAGGTSSAFVITPQQRAADNIAQNITTVTEKYVDKALAIQPTIIISAGKKVNILVNKDLIMSPYNL